VRILYEYNNAAMISDSKEQRSASNQQSALSIQSLNGEHIRSEPVWGRGSAPPRRVEDPPPHYLPISPRQILSAECD